MFEITQLAQRCLQLGFRQARQVHERGVGHQPLNATVPFDPGRRGQHRLRSGVRRVAARAFVGEDLRQLRDEIAEGAAGGTAVPLGFENVDTALRQSPDVGDLRLHLEAFALHRVEFVHGLRVETVGVPGLQNSVDTADMLRHCAEATAPFGMNLTLVG